MEQQPDFVILDGTRISDVRATLDERSLQFEVGGRRGLHLYTFSTLMLPIESGRSGEETFSFAGPRLGLYHETADPREGPFLNHYLASVELRVSYPARDVAVIDVKGWADRSRSSFDAYWYKGPVAGRWTFEAHMSYRFRSP